MHLDVTIQGTMRAIEVLEQSAVTT
jgi:hypothetical protein